MVKATSRSKIANHMLNSLTNRTTSLYDFLVSFEGWWAYGEMIKMMKIFNVKKSKPTPVHKNCEILLHSAS